MSALDTKPCYHCETRHVSRDADAWCITCEKAFCHKCRYTHLSGNSNHKFISIQKYNKLALTVHKICKHDHDSKFHIYCKFHDDITCNKCKPETHSKCNGVQTIQEASKNAKTSFQLSDLEKKVSELSGTLQKLIASRTKNLNTIKDQKKKIETELEALRKKINDHITKIQKNLLGELNKVYERTKDELDESLKELDREKTLIHDLKDKTIQIKHLSTNVETFLGTHQLRKRYAIDEKHTSDMLRGIKHVYLRLSISPVVQSLVSDITSFGIVEMVNKPDKVTDDEHKLSESRAGKISTPPRFVMRVKLHLRKTIKSPSDSGEYMKGCTSSSNGQMIFAEPSKKVLSIYDSKGNFYNNIPVSAHPFDVTSINYYTFAVTYDKMSFIEMLDISKINGIVTNRYRTNYPCRGISYMSGQIYVVVETEGIQVMDISGNVQKRISINVNGVRFFTTSNSRLYYTNTDAGTVHCCDMRGKEMWKFEDKNISRPHGLGPDSSGNVFVVGYSDAAKTTAPNSYDVILVSPDGQYARKLLRRSGSPSSVHYDKRNKRLLLYSHDGSVDWYEIV